MEEETEKEKSSGERTEMEFEKKKKAERERLGMKTAGEREEHRYGGIKSVSKKASALLRALFMSWRGTTLLSGPPLPDKNCLSH